MASVELKQAKKYLNIFNFLYKSDEHYHKKIIHIILLLSFGNIEEIYTVNKDITSVSD